MNDGSPNAGNAALTVSGTTGVMTTVSGASQWVNENAVVIGLSISVLSLLVGLMFQISTVRWRARQETQDREALRREILAELKKDITPDA